jgi:hypothetical protein
MPIFTVVPPYPLFLYASRLSTPVVSLKELGIYHLEIILLADAALKEGKRI